MRAHRAYDVCSTTVCSPDELPFGCRQARLRRATGALALALVLAAGAAGCAARSGPPAGGNAVADAQTALVNDLELGTLPIDVQASGGVVTLHGTVAEEAQVERALPVRRLPVRPPQGDVHERHRGRHAAAARERGGPERRGGVLGLLARRLPVPHPQRRT